MGGVHRLLALTFLLVCVSVSSASADELIAPVSGGRSLAGGGGWLAWAVPSGDAWKLLVRSPGGVVSDAAVGRFGAAPDASIGFVGAAAERWVAVYSRCAGRSAVRGCDLYEYDPLRRRERKLSGLSTRAGSERAPSVQHSSYAFARGGGPRPGTYTATAARVRRIDPRVAGETALSGKGQVAYLAGGWAVASALSGARRNEIAPVDAFGLFMTPGVRVGWLVRTAAGAVEARRTARLRGPLAPAVGNGLRPLSPTTDSVVAGPGSQIAFYLDAQGVHAVDPPVFYP